MRPVEQFKKIWGQKWGRRVVIISVVTLLASIPMRCGGPYKGKVIDEDTDRPISGALAVVSWTRTTINPAGGSTYCVDAEETVTDEKGEFVIHGSRGRVFGLFTGTPKITVYKVGYKQVECDWNYLDKPGACYLKPRGFENGRAIFPLKKVPLREGGPPDVYCGRKDGKPLLEYIKAGEEYRRAMGYKR